MQRWSWLISALNLCMGHAFSQYKTNFYCLAYTSSGAALSTTVSPVSGEGTCITS